MQRCWCRRTRVSPRTLWRLGRSWRSARVTFRSKSHHTTELGLKKEGDAFFQRAEFACAEASYSAALSLDAGLFPQGQPADCLTCQGAVESRSCQAQVGELRRRCGGLHEGPEPARCRCVHCPLIAEGTVDSKAAVRVLVRRGTAFCSMGRFEKGMRCACSP
jgi:hypothetical protein